MSRGLRLQNIGLPQRLRNFIPLLTPLLLGAIEEAYRRSIALEARGFSSKARKTFLRDPKMTSTDGAFLASVLLIIVLVSLLVSSALPRPNPWTL